jgi:DNA repair protein RecN (Recombination protein N)
MLTHLRIKDFAIIEEAAVEFGPGLNALTGETGSGKSLLLDALGLLVGARASGNYVRTGCSLGSVEGVFELDTDDVTAAADILADSGIELTEDLEVIIRREVNSSGRGKIFINNRLATLAVLRSLQSHLATIQSQGEQFTLFNERAQLDFLDEFAGSAESRAEVQDRFRELRTAQSALTELESKASDYAKREDYLRFQLSEINQVSPEAGEDERISAELNVLKHLEKIRELMQNAYALLYESDDSVLSKLALVERDLKQLGAFDDRVTVWSEGFTAACATLQDISESLRGYGGSIETSESSLDDLEGRLADLERLKRKHGTDLDGILRIKGELEAQLSSLESLEFDRQELVKRLSEARTRYSVAASALSRSRVAAATRFAREVRKNLAPVALEEARFEVRVDASPQDGDPGNGTPPGWSETGFDHVGYFFSANPGEPLRPLSEVASGGELSRLFLVLQTVQPSGPGSAGAAVGTVVFDEIDVGIGGRVAEAVGRRLKDLAKNRQVLCVTHQPQIARFADRHFAVVKETDGKRTRTSVGEIDGEARVRELVRMVGGKDDAESRRIVDLIFETGKVETRHRSG